MMNTGRALGAAPVPADPAFASAVLSGLSAMPKAVPSRFLYDTRGSELFEEITELPEYYLTRTEMALLADNGTTIGQLAPERATVIEFGSGSSRKTELLLRHLREPAAYVPIDISAAALFPAARRIRSAFPNIAVRPRLAGFDDLDRVGLPVPRSNLIGFFPGSTIGNFARGEAVAFLKSVRAFLGEGALLLIGADLKKPLEVLLPAYNDSAGVTAAFNLNLLTRINRELQGTFDERQFAHDAVFNEKEGRIEMHLRAKAAHTVWVGGVPFTFARGETIHTENSYKYTTGEFLALAAAAGFEPIRLFLDGKNLFSVHLLIG